MLKRLRDLRAVRQGIHARQTVADGPAELSSEWLAEAGRVAVAEESGRLLETDQCMRLAAACREANLAQLLAVSNDPLVDDDLVYSLDASEKDMMAFSDEFSGINALLVPTGSLDVAVLCTVDDFHLVAGSRDFVQSYAGDIAALRREFLEFADEHFEAMQPLLHRAARYMDWIGESR